MMLLTMMQSIMFKTLVSIYIQVILILPESTLPDETKDVLNQRNAKIFGVALHIKKSIMTFIICFVFEQKIVLIGKECDINDIINGTLLFTT